MVLDIVHLMHSHNHFRQSYVQEFSNLIGDRTKGAVTNQIRELLNRPIRFILRYSINFMRLSPSQLLLRLAFLFTETLEQCLERCIHVVVLNIHSDYVTCDVILNLRGQVVRGGAETNACFA